MVKVKVCGLTSVGDAVLALEAGADYVGFIVDVPVETPRKIKLSKAEAILQEIERSRAIIVVMPSTLKEVEAVLDFRPSALQFHGNETPEFMREVRDITSQTHILKALHVKNKSNLSELKQMAMSYAPYVDFLLLDTQSDRMGGTGLTHDWGVSAALVKSFEKPVFLSGGLYPGNVRAAVLAVRPYGVDGSSGLELSPGVKDPLKVSRFVSEVRACST
jgi:phosphoribosylanthranilate isomerase